MSLTLRGITKTITKGITRVTTEGTLLLHDAAAPGGSRLQTLWERRGLMNLTLGTSMETQGMVSNLWHH